MSQELPKTKESKTYQPTPEQFKNWKQINELEHGVTVGFCTVKEDDRRVKKLLETDYIETQIERLRTHIKKLIENLNGLNIMKIYCFKKEKNGIKDNILFYIFI